MALWTSTALHLSDESRIRSSNKQNPGEFLQSDFSEICEANAGIVGALAIPRPHFAKICPDLERRLGLNSTIAASRRRAMG
jgi:hypothetical protein